MSNRYYIWSHPCIPYTFNFGDLITPLLMNAYGLFEHTEPAAAGYFNPFGPEAAARGNSDLAVVGSVLDDYDTGHPNFTIIGAGLLREKYMTFHQGVNIRALRGEKTKKCLGLEGRDDIVLGDPGLLVSRVLPMTISDAPDKPIAIVPHWTHFESPRLDAYRSNPCFKVLNPRCAPQEIAREICSSSAVVAESLHALIIADSYGVPNIRMKFDNEQIDTDDFKYEDYYSAIKRGGQAASFVKPEEILSVNPALWDTGYMSNVKTVQDALHKVFRNFANDVRQHHGDRHYPDCNDLSEALKAADKGDVNRMNHIGDMYYEGKGVYGGNAVRKDLEKARYWYQAAADRGYRWGMYNLGKYYYDMGNYAESRKWYTLAADFGEVYALEELARKEWPAGATSSISPPTSDDGFGF